VKPLYANDLHQCVKCGCTFLPASLRECRRVDQLLRLDETVFVCLDEKRCARFKIERELHLNESPSVLLGLYHAASPPQSRHALAPSKQVTEKKTPLRKPPQRRLPS
jgi:hypothetical protein